MATDEWLKIGSCEESGSSSRNKATLTNRCLDEQLGILILNSASAKYYGALDNNTDTTMASRRK